MPAKIDPVDGRIDIRGQNAYQHQNEKNTRQSHEPWNPHAYGSEQLKYSGQVNKLYPVRYGRGYHRGHLFRSDEMSYSCEDEEE